MPEQRAAGAACTRAGQDTAGPSLDPQNSIRAANPKEKPIFPKKVTQSARTFESASMAALELFSSAQEYQSLAARLDSLAANYRDLKFPEEGAIKEMVTLAAIRPGADRQKLLLMAAQFALITRDRVIGGLTS